MIWKCTGQCRIQFVVNEIVQADAAERQKAISLRLSKGDNSTAPDAPSENNNLQEDSVYSSNIVVNAAALALQEASSSAFSSEF
jgi:hypothetical protein